ncbi:hypothetical protein I4U23_027513 [Adineta vaga]|nr:hypothetical protein I4U23_027513 [Adineta vaga]
MPLLWNEHKFHSHTVHHLGALSLLGANDEQLRNIYESSMRPYDDKYEPSPHEITKDNWRNSIDDKRFCTAYRNFFNAELPIEGYWKEKFFEYILDDTNGSALIFSSLDSLIHPIIHIGYAILLNSRIVACVHSYYETPTNLKPPTNGKKSSLQIIKDIRRDDHVPNLDEPFQICLVLKDDESVLLEHYNEWQMPEDCDKTIEELFDMAVYIYGATHKPDQIDFDFVIYSLKDAEKDYESKNELYLKAAVKSVDHLRTDTPYNYYKSHEPWIGMSDANRELNVNKH